MTSQLACYWLHKVGGWYGIKIRYTRRKHDTGFSIRPVVFVSLYCIQIIYRYMIKNNMRSRDICLLQLLSNCNLCPVNILNVGNGAVCVLWWLIHVYYWLYFDTCCETIDCTNHCDVADDHCLNMSRHRPLVCCLTVNFDTACSDHKPATYCNVNWKRAGRQDYVNYCALLANDAGLTNICHEQLTSSLEDI